MLKFFSSDSQQTAQISEGIPQVIFKFILKKIFLSSDLMNSQYTYYGAGLISAKDRFNENQQKIVRKEQQQQQMSSNSIQ